MNIEEFMKEVGPALRRHSWNNIEQRNLFKPKYVNFSIDTRENKIWKVTFSGWRGIVPEKYRTEDCTIAFYNHRTLSLDQQIIDFFKEADALLQHDEKVG